MRPTIILGAGLTGLAAASEIPGAVVYEAKDHPGGHCWSHEIKGMYFDEGAHICHAKDESWLRMLFENAGEVITFEQSRVANYWHGYWTTYPVQNHLRDLPPSLRIQALSDLVQAQIGRRDHPPQTYAEWIQSSYGEFLAERFYREYTDKYWRVPMEEMDVDWLSGRLLPADLGRIIHGAIAPIDERQSVFSTFHYPARGGFYSFFQKFGEGLDIRYGARAVEINTRSRTIRFQDGRIAEYSRLLSTAPLPDLVAAIPEAPDAVRAAAARLRHTRLLVVALQIQKANLSPNHWFYVYDADVDVARVKVISNVTPAACPRDSTVLQCEIFRRNDEPWNIASLTQKAAKDLGSLLGFDPDKDVVFLERIEVSHAYPIPLRGRAAAVRAVLDWLETQGIVSAGLYGRWKYMWSHEAFADGREAARRLMVR